MQRLFDIGTITIATAALPLLSQAAYSQENLGAFGDERPASAAVETAPTAESVPAVEQPASIAEPASGIAESDLRYRVATFMGYDEELTFGGASFGLWIPGSPLISLHGLGGFNWFNIDDKDEAGTLYRTSQKDPFMEGLFGIGCLFDIDGDDNTADESRLELLLGYRYFNLERQNSDGRLLMNRNDCILGLGLNLSEYMALTGKFYGFVDEKDYQSFAGIVDLSSGRLISEGAVRLLFGATADYFWTRETEQRFWNLYGGLSVQPIDSLLIGGAFLARYGDIFDKQSDLLLDRTGRFPAMSEERSLWSYGGFGRIAVLPDERFAVYADIGGDSDSGFTLYGGLQYRFGSPNNFMNRNRTFSPAVIRPPSIAGWEGGGQGAR